MATHNDLGKAGEQIAFDHLVKNGYAIIERNWRYQHSEVDLIAQKNNELIFIEVKTRTGNFFGFPEEFVTSRKEKLFGLAADEFIYRSAHTGECRFDIVSITFSTDGKSYQVHHIEDAFFPR
ncbi:YraN family protein [Solitalea canadensis]|uniref:UPF0102 protein Solca_4112 n=1 Tax=Solitalea canadensis (strain ATCC 29591 / DSM 3403 / JCM 21819 / LMG 8368 / NBRC 15130 / NCIMB 12057 / USAM 9D) TaxID=929556 RepID=H8KN23_SOLCM|nr:YraN family protein [Solitalea canadensis]AFD09102.1 putative endonuclease related to Holliday junction resolvase [Solitalea canadensis DSM 3403]